MTDSFLTPEIDVDQLVDRDAIAAKLPALPKGYLYRVWANGVEVWYEIGYSEWGTTKPTYSYGQDWFTIDTKVEDGVTKYRMANWRSRVADTIATGHVDADTIPLLAAVAKARLIPQLKKDHLIGFIEPKKTA